MSAVGPAAPQGIDPGDNSAAFTVNINVADVEVADSSTGLVEYYGDPWKVQWNTAILAGISGTNVKPPEWPAALCAPAPPVIDNVLGTANGGCVANTAADPPDTGSTFVGAIGTVRLKCIAAGVSPLTLIPFAADPMGTATLDSGGPAKPTTLNAGSVTCEEQSDLEVIKTHTPEPAIAGSVMTYTVTVHNIGPLPARGALLIDIVPLDKEIQGLVTNPGGGLPAGTYLMPPVGGLDLNMDTTPDFPCQYYPVFPFPAPIGTQFNVLLCAISSGPFSPPLPAALAPSQSVKAVIPVIPDLTSAGKVNVNTAMVVLTDDPLFWYPLSPDPTIDPNPANDVAIDVAHIALGAMTFTKSGLPNPATGGGTITWTVTATCLATGSPCTNALGTAGPVITDTVSAVTQSAITAITLTNVVGSNSCVSLPSLPISPPTPVTCSLASVMQPGDQVKLIIDATVDPNLPSMTTCNNAATVTWGEPQTLPASASVACVPPVIEHGIDKGSGVFPAPIAVLVGQTVRVNVWEQIEVDIPGPNPNIIHTWTANAGGDGVAVDWVDPPGTDTPPGFTNFVDTLNFQTGPHVAGLVVVSRQLDVKCEAQTGPITVPIGMTSKAGSSPTSLQVQCFNQPQEVKSPSQASLWIMRHPNCLNPVTGNYDVGPCADSSAGKGWLKINEVISAVADADSPNDADSNPEGLGAYEKQVKFDHKLVNLKIEDAGLLGATGRAVNCTMTIVTENWIMFGCVSTGTALGVTGPGPATLSTISVYPVSDLVSRIRPTKDNGVVTTLLDENCEWADIYGDPMLGMVNGGLVPVCGDSTLTIRMLEGDLNLDCNVDVLDQQAIAFRYGASFGLLLYAPFYDLEPKLTDFDIDIKDLQFVFGRDGSTCSNPIPLQPPSPPIP